MSDKKKSPFHDFPEGLQITDIMYELQEDQSTRHSNTSAMDRQCNYKQESHKLVKREELENSTDEFIQCPIYRQMWDSDWRWKTAGEAKK